MSYVGFTWVIWALGGFTVGYVGFPWVTRVLHGLRRLRGFYVGYVRFSYVLHGFCLGFTRALRRFYVGVRSY